MNPTILYHPADTQHIWKRLIDLDSLDWPLPAEIVERRAITKWLSPIDAALSYSAVTTLAEKVHMSSPRWPVNRVEVIKTAQEAWSNLEQLSQGDALPHPRPENSRKSLIRAQIAQWSTAVLETFRMLELQYFCALDTFEKQLDNTWAGKQIKERTIKVAYEDPYVIGVNTYLYWYLPKNGACKSKLLLYCLETYTSETVHAIANWHTVDQDDIDAFRLAATHLAFTWQRLKGFLAAASEEPSQYEIDLCQLIAREKDQGIWKKAHATLMEGRSILRKREDTISALVLTKLNEPEPGSTGRKKCEDIIKKITDRIAAHRKQLRNPE